MAKIVPFRGLRPRADLVDRIIAPPYDVIDSDEARALAAGNPHSFLHVSKSEIDLDPSVPLYDGRVYAKARENLDAFRSKGWLERDPAPALYLYRLSIDGHAQTGLVAGAAVAEYEQGLIKKHELTRADKEKDRTVHTETLDAHTGPVFLAYRRRDEIDALVRRVTSGPPDADVTTYDRVRNQLWVVRDPAPFIAAFATVPSLYIADGHHRAASYCRLGGSKRGSGNAEYESFLAVLFPHSELRILPYNRVVKDLHGLTAEQFRSRLESAFTIAPDAAPSPKEKHSFSMYLEGKWWELRPKPGSFPEADPIRSLDVSILQENLLAPVLGIEDPRRDHRIDFVGGIRGTGELVDRVRAGAAVAFSLHPVSMDDLFAIADAGAIMPPKSTWFEPKLKDALVIKSLGGERP